MLDRDYPGPSAIQSTFQEIAIRNFYDGLRIATECERTPRGKRVLEERMRKIWKLNDEGEKQYGIEELMRYIVFYPRRARC